MYEKMLMVVFQLEEMNMPERAFKRWAEYLEAEYTPQERAARVESLDLVRSSQLLGCCILQESIESWHSRQSHLGSSNVQVSEDSQPFRFRQQAKVAPEFPTQYQVFTVAAAKLLS